MFPDKGQDAAECFPNPLGSLFGHGMSVSFHKVNTQDFKSSLRILPDLPPDLRTSVSYGDSLGSIENFAITNSYGSMPQEEMA